MVLACGAAFKAIGQVRNPPRPRAPAQGDLSRLLPRVQKKRPWLLGSLIIYIRKTGSLTQSVGLRNFCSVAIWIVGVGATDGPTMLIPAYDPVAIAVLGFGIVLAAGLTFAF